LDFSPGDCPRCGFGNYAHEEFCGGCGVRLEVAEAPGRAEAERRQLTVMFCDLVGSTALSGTLDPEELREHIVAFQRCCAQAVERFDGFVARYMGDGLLVYFGYPRAQEDSAERAVRAGLAVVSDVAGLSSERFDPHVRVGIATGRVVVGDIIGTGASEERAVVGETPNLAARLQSLAHPDAVVLSGRTRRLVGEAFEMEDLGRHPLKGFDEPVRAWRAIAERRATSLAPSGPEGQLAGRGVELRTLRDRWTAAIEGHGHVVELVGESGAGKTHLLAHFAGGLADTVLRHQCRRHDQAVGLHPIRDRIGVEAGLELADDVAQRREKLRAWVEGWSDDLDTDVPGIHALFSVDDRPDLSPDARREELLRSLDRELRAHLRRGPVLLAFEDVQWLDALTEAFLDRVLPGAVRESVLTVLTRRPDTDGRRGATALPLGPLPEDEALQLVTRIDPELPEATAAQIVDRGGGLPGFLVELTRAVGSGSTVPETLLDSLAAQLDRLGADRDLAQVAAVIGREFSPELLRHLALADLDRKLGALVRAEIVVPNGTGYTFRHPLLREVAYDSLLKRSRRELHDRIATVLIDDLPDAARADPSSVARHLAQAARPWEAASWYERAAERATRQGAAEEAMTLLQRALERVEPALSATQGEANSADSDHRAHTEQVARTLTRLARVGRFVASAEDTRALLDRARALAEAHDLAAVLARIYTEYGNLYFRLGDPEACTAAHRRSLDEARRAGDEQAEAIALGGLADAALALGDTMGCERLAEQSAEAAERHGDALTAGLYGGLAAWSAAWNMRFEAADALAVRAVRSIERSRHLRSQMSVDNARFLIGLSTLDIEAAQRAEDALRASPAMAQSFLAAVAQWNDAWLARLRGLDYEADVRAFLSSPAGSGPLRLNVRSLLLSHEPEEAYHDLLSTLLTEMHDVFMVGVLDLPIEMVYAQIARRDFSRMAEVLEGLERRMAKADLPAARLWMDAGAAVAAWWDAPDDDAAIAALDAVKQRARGSAEHLLWTLDQLGHPP
jgi:class 3 adenylate cyclase